VSILVFLKFAPKIEVSIRSLLSGQIQVVRRGGEASLVVGNLTQSGPFLERLWTKALKRLQAKKIKTVLILGLGGGSVIKPLRRFWPDCQIVGVEQDLEIIKLAQKYLSFKPQSLRLEVADAFQFVNKGKSNFYDLIIVDLYIGSEIPVQTKSNQFLNDLKRIAKPKSEIIFNHLYFRNHKNSAQKFLAQLSEVFDNVSAIKDFPIMATNLLIYCQN